MSQNQEIIESKLCAYIDGELDPEGRAEIEKHLEANPQHRRLLESLRATRDLIRWLPREPAPPEVAETLNGQLERSVLLNYEGDSLRTNLWPRIFAAAAILLLTAGLGVAVYYALPRSQKPQLAIRSSGNDSNANEFVPVATMPDSAPTADSETVDRLKADREEMKKDSSAGDQKLADQTSPLAVSMGKTGASSLSARDLDQLAEQVSQNPAAFLASAEGANNAVAQNVAPPNYNAMVVLVRSNAPEQTEKQLTSYLNQQQIQYRQPAMAQQAEGALQPQQRGWGPTNDGAKDAIADRRGMVEAPASPAPQPNLAPTTQPTQNNPSDVSQSVVALQQGFGGGARGVRPNRVYVCQMSRRQAEQLSNTIGSDAVPGNQVQNLNTLSNNGAIERSAGDRSAGQNVSPGESAGQLEFRSGGLEREQFSKAMPTTELAAATPRLIAAKADHSFSATQPASAPSFAMSRSLEGAHEVQQQLAETQPGSTPSDAQQAAATSPSGLGVAMATTGPVDAPVNVVIMVQPNDALAGRSTAVAPPASQPIGAPYLQKARAVPTEQQPALK